MPRRKIPREKKEPRERRTHCVSSRLSPSELATLDERRGNIPRGEYVRTCTFGTPPVPIPQPNADKYAELSRAAGNLNQIARKLNQGAFDIEATIDELAVFRMKLLGVTWDGDSDESEDK
ncbi:MAG: MobC family plasmid mobilization relaxosome protein [Clostridiales bacterium]|jgi:hypothetical protein|nr:plasmid mobilization relaxosome protein MobC [Bacteroidia bacterium]NLT49283.1 MobC family plasmid mobilization relaxosome protein [Clostridiales bacterium]